MIPRYNRPKIEKIWSLENKFKIWTEIECLIAEKQAMLGIIPKKAAVEIRKKAKFNVKEIDKLEKETKHDVLAYIQNVSKYIGESSKFFHHGITSSDIIDTSFSIQLKQSSSIIIKNLEKLIKILKDQSLKYKYTLMIGRSHGIHAEPITFGIKLATFYSEFKRSLKRLKNAQSEISICSISGPVGTYNTIDPSVEKFVAEKLNLSVENIATQIIPRDRHASFFSNIGILASSIERLATEIRNLQRTEISEVAEYFDLKQKGSSAMPHKKNPILSENLSGITRYIRSTVMPAMENVSLWHERDISHSSVERIIAPDVTIAIDFAINRMCRIVENLIVYPEKMLENINKTGGLYKSQKLLLALIQKGLSREEAYNTVQKAALESMDTKNNFEKIISTNDIIKKYFEKNELNNILSSEEKIEHIETIFKNVFDK